MNKPPNGQRASGPSPTDKVIRFFLEKKVIVLLLIILVIGWGLMVAPFDWKLGGLPRSPVPVDAIPDIGENQQIVFTDWMGRSPQDVEDQITYPLTVSLLGVPKVRTIRSYSAFGFSTIYVIFEDKVDFYWARSRVLEKLNSLASGTLPDGVQPRLGPDATALGQVFWYTLEGRDAQGNPAGGWSLDELRTIQDWHVRYSLLSAEGISEVASIGGFVKEYQIDVDPDAMRAYNVSLGEVVAAVRMSNVDVGARTIEINRVEYVIRGLGFVKSLDDIENTVVKVNDNVPIYVKNVGTVALGPALRRGALDKEGAEAVGGVVVVRYDENPLAAINNVKERIKEIAPGLPKKTLPDGTVSQVTIVPFYDRTGLIHETLGTLNTALSQEILVTIIVIIIMVVHLRSSMLISAVLPMAVLMCFIAMKLFGVDANIVALSGIAIAIGTIVDMGIIICENILKHLEQAGPDENRLEVVYRAASEVGSAVLTAVATTVVSFLPVFTMIAAEGKLFRPLAFTKTFALVASVIFALTVIPSLALVFFPIKVPSRALRRVLLGALVAAGVLIGVFVVWWAGALVALVGAYRLVEPLLPPRLRRSAPWVTVGLVAGAVAVVLAQAWLPLGPEKGLLRNLVFVAGIIGLLLAFFLLFQRVYPRILRWCLDHKAAFLAIPIVLVFLGGMAWLGFDAFFGWLPRPLRTSRPVSAVAHAFPGLGKEFMPPLDEGSFLWMPTTMPHASIGESLDTLQKQDMAIRAVPEVDTVVGKIGRAESPLDPAPISMIETVINYRPEYIVDRNGRRIRFRFDPGRNDTFRAEDGTPLPAPDGEPYVVAGRFVRDEEGRLIPDRNGRPFRLWRPALDPALQPDGDRAAWSGIRNPNDIWEEIVAAAQVPGSTTAPKLQPIETRLVMLQTGMRAPMGLKVKGPDLEAIEQFGIQVERLLREVPSIEERTVSADRIVAKPYLEIDIDREAIARHGVMLRQVQDVIETAIGGQTITTTVEGRERFPVRVRYARELRDTIEALEGVLVPAHDGAQIPLRQLTEAHTEISLNAENAMDRNLDEAAVANALHAFIAQNGIRLTYGSASSFPVHVRRKRDWLTHEQAFETVTVRNGAGEEIALSDVLRVEHLQGVRYTPGPQMIKSEDTFLVGYVTFGMKPGYAEVDVVRHAQAYLEHKEMTGELQRPPGVSYTFSGSYENQVRAARTLAVVLPLALLIIFLILYLQFNSVPRTLLVFSGIVVAWSGGFILIWLYAQPWFLDFAVFGTSMRELFSVHPINLSVAVWVGFLALFGIASDNGVLITTYLNQSFVRHKPMTAAEVRAATIEASLRRIRPALMTSATTILALVPVLTSTGRGADVMVPMAIPSFGGMLLALITVFVVPVLYCAIEEHKLKGAKRRAAVAAPQM
ncbi:MAG: efflux RND transporter permease subunit [Verrucomicrobia bacterium]|nr:efflux RND transporter permease subunit [Verrucomicrobiota bacterium]